MVCQFLNYQTNFIVITSYSIHYTKLYDSPLYATAVGLVLDGLKRHERKRIEQKIEETKKDDIKPQVV